MPEITRSMTDGPFRPEPYLIVPRDEMERYGGIATLLTTYHIEEITAALLRTTYDPDLLKKMTDLLGAA